MPSFSAATAYKRKLIKSYYYLKESKSYLNVYVYWVGASVNSSFIRSLSNKSVAVENSNYSNNRFCFHCRMNKLKFKKKQQPKHKKYLFPVQHKI